MLRGQTEQAQNAGWQSAAAMLFGASKAFGGFGMAPEGSSTPIRLFTNSTSLAQAVNGSNVRCGHLLFPSAHRSRWPSDSPAKTSGLFPVASVTSVAPGRNGVAMRARRLGG